jgi:hypothetical protein
VETSPVTIAEFIAKWKKAELKERPRLKSIS